MAEGTRREAPGGTSCNGRPPARSELPYRLRLHIPNAHPAIDRAVEKVRRLARRCGCDEGSRTDFEIALREALANAMVHGNAMQPGRQVFLRCYAGPRAGILVVVRDEGAGFDPRSVPDPRSADGQQLDHGRGLLLMRELTDGVTFRRGGREVLLYRRPAT